MAARHERSFTLLVGNDSIFTRARREGADGVVSGVACAVPELLRGLENAICAGNESLVQQLDARLAEFIAQIDRLPVPLGIKAATEVRGLKVGPPAVPLSPQSQRVLDEFKEWFQSWLPEVR